MSVYLLFSRRESLPKWRFLIPGIAVMLGISYIVYHYSSWASLNNYLLFMKRKFGTRTVGEEGPSYISFLPSNLNIIFFYLLSYGALLIFSMIALIKKKFSPLVWLIIITAILHHIVFWGFSSEHDYAALKMCFPLAFAAALLISTMNRRTVVTSISFILTCSISQYFLLHNYSYRKGIYEDEQYFVKAGEAIKKHPADEIVFVNTEGKYFPQVEFYAGKNYKTAISVEDGKQQMMKANIKGNAVFLDWKNGQFIDSSFTAELLNKVPNVEVSDTTKAK